MPPQTDRSSSASVNGSRRKGPEVLLLLSGLLAILAASVIVEKMWVLILVIYLVASVVVFCLYAWDKAAAREQRWRVSEGMLLMLGMAGGWPGALLAQQIFRHKTRKLSFQIKFWLTVVLNGLVLWAWLSPRQFHALVMRLVEC